MASIAARKLAALLIVALFLLSNTASATNWVYLQRQEGTRYGAGTEYFDADSVVEMDGKMVYWSILVLDKKNDYDGAKKLLWKMEAPLNGPLRHSRIEGYIFDSTDNELKHMILPSYFYDAPPDEIAIIREYAKPANGPIAPEPSHIITPSPRWYGFIEYPDCKLYWDIHSITAWPKDNPTTVGITVKLVWNKEGLEKRRAYLASQSRTGYKYEDLAYTIMTYQFLTFDNRVRVIEVTDYQANNIRMTLLDGTSWRSIEQGSKEETVRKLALNWLKNSEEERDKAVIR
jgi:hypothetical protein